MTSAFFRDMLAPLIKAAGCQVVAVGSAAEALKALKSEKRFDLVITDIEMPEMDGFALAEALRAMPRHRSSAGHRDYRHGLGRRGRTRTRGRIPRLRRQVRPHRIDRGNQGTGHRHRSGSMTAMDDNPQLTDYVTFSTGGQIFGLPIARVQEVFQARADHARAARRRADCGRAQSARPHRHRDRYAQPPRPAGARGRLGADGDRNRIARRVVRPSGRCAWRGAQAVGQPISRPTRQPRPQARRPCRPACIGSTVSCWSCSTSTACSTSAPKRRRRDRKC